MGSPLVLPLRSFFLRASSPPAFGISQLNFLDSMLDGAWPGDQGLGRVADRTEAAGPFSVPEVLR